jgi:hypothetical protein
MRSTARVTVLAVVLLLLAAAIAALEADTGSTVPDRVVVVTGEDLFVLRSPEPAGWAAVELPETDLSLPVTGRDPPLVPPIPTWSAPAPVQVISLLEAPDA